MAINNPSYSLASIDVYLLKKCIYFILIYFTVEPLFWDADLHQGYTSFGPSRQNTHIFFVIITSIEGRLLVPIRVPMLKTPGANQGPNVVPLFKTLAFMMCYR